MPSALARTFSDGLSNFTNQAPIFEKSVMPFRLQSDQDSQAMAMRLIEKPARRRGICPHSINAVRGHRCKVLLDNLRRRKCVAIRIRPEGSVGHTASVTLFFVDPKTFS